MSDSVREAPPVHVVIVAYGSPRLLARCLDTLLAGGVAAGAVAAGDVTVVDNGSSTETGAVCEAAAVHYVDPGQNLGFAAGVNRALALLPLPDVDVLLLNPDAVVTSATVARLQAELVAQPRLACAAPAQHAPDVSEPDRVCWPFPTPLGAWVEAVGLGALRRRCDFVIGSVLLIRGTALVEVGGFDERFFLYAEEQDWQHRARRAGWDVACVTEVTALHEGGGTQDRRRQSELRFHCGVERYVRKWHGPFGWLVFRAATVVRGLLRAAARHGDRRREALDLARLYAAGPERSASRTGEVPPPRPQVPALGAPTAPLHIVHVVCTDNFAGVERYVATLAVEQAARGHDVHVIGGHHRFVPAALEGTAVSWEPCTSTGSALSALMRRRGLDLVHCHMTEAEAAGTAVSLVLRVPVVTTRHFAQSRGATTGGHLVAPFIARRMAAQIAISRFVADHVEGTCVVVPNGVAEAPLGPRAEPVVLVAQRLEAEKDTATALRAWAASGLAARGWRMEIAGTGDEEDTLRALAERLDITSTCRFLGFRDDVDECMARSRILLATSPGEPFGLSVVEAMARGVAVVATGTGAFAETVGSCADARLFSPGDAGGAATHLVALADDPKAADEYSSALRRLQQARFTVSETAKRTEAVYRAVQLGTRARRRRHW
jgi:GT2 family glycosyltransferase/glycosyltransferase involved in cell wall biosynthesis